MSMSLGPLELALRSALRSAASHLDGGPLRRSLLSPRHPLAPAAVRVERSRSRAAGDRSEQTAVTLWFGQGPSLPGPGLSGPALRATMRVGAGILGAAAFAAASTMAARRAEERLAAGPQVRRLRPPAAAP